MRDGSGRYARQLGDVFYSNATHTRGFSLRSVWRRKVGRDEAAFLISPLYVKSFAEQCYNSLPYVKRFFFRNLTLQVFKELPFPSVSATDVASWTLQELAPGPTATTKYVAGVVPTFLIPCSSLECTNPTEPGPRRELVPLTVSSTVPSRISHISECTWWCGGWGATPGGSVVSCTSNDSPVASLPFRTSRICAFFGVRIGSFSNGYIADGMDPSCAAAPSGRITAGKRTAGSKRHISRRVMHI